MAASNYQQLLWHELVYLLLPNIKFTFGAKSKVANELWASVSLACIIYCQNGPCFSNTAFKLLKN